MEKVITVTPNPAIDLTIHVSEWERGRVNRGEHMHVTPGGKGLTVALNLAEAGIHSRVTGWMGAHNDAPFTRAFEAHDIVDDFIRYPGDTRRNVKIVDNSNGETTDINMPGQSVCAELLQRQLDYLDSEVDSNTVLVFGGSLPPGIDKDFYARMSAKYRDKCRYLVIDTSDCALKAMMESDVLPHIIKPNIHELEGLTGRSIETAEDIVEQAREFIARGIKLAVVSAGEKGAWFVTEDTVIHAQPPKVKVASTVGAGDAMVAGTVRGLLLGRPLEEIARTATAYSVANIMEVGISLPPQDEIERIRKKVTITKQQ